MNELLGRTCAGKRRNRRLGMSIWIIGGLKLLKCSVVLPEPWRRGLKANKGHDLVEEAVGGVEVDTAC